MGYNLSSYLKIECKANGRDLGNGAVAPDYFEESESYVYTVDDSVQEYSSDEVSVFLRPGDDNLRFMLKDDPDSQKIDKQSNGTWVLRFSKSPGGVSSGVRTATITLSFDSDQLADQELEVYLPVTPGHLRQVHYNLMLKRIGGWLNTSLVSTIYDGVVHTTDEDSSDTVSGLSTLLLVEKRTNQIYRIAKTISRDPHSKVIKNYHTSRKPKGKKDPNSLRQDIRNSRPNTERYYQTRESYDTIPNRFLYLIISTLESPIRKLKDAVQSTIRKFSRELDKEKEWLRKYKRDPNKGKREIDKQKEKVSNKKKYLDKSHKMESRIKRTKDKLVFTKKMEIFDSIDDEDARSTPDTYPLSLTEDVRYSQAVTLFQDIKRDENIRRIRKAESFKKSISKVGTKKTRKVYEYWTYFATVKSLINEGFKLDGQDASMFDEVVNQETLDPSMSPGSYVELTSPDKYEFEKVRVHYEYKFPGASGDVMAKPDITITRYKTHERCRHRRRICLDAKYKDFSDKSSFEDLPRKTVKRKAKSQYQSTDRGGCVPGSCGCIILYPGSSDSFSREPTSVEFARNKKIYAVVPMIPTNRRSLELLLERIMRRTFEEPG